MKDLIRKLLKEGLNDTITYEEEHLGNTYGQDNYELGLYLNGEIVGLVEYVIFEGELTISNIIVRPEFRRRGFGSRMMQYVKKIHPEAKYVPSMMTDLGAKFKHKEISDLNTLDEGMGKEIGYKVMRYENGMLIAGANSNLRFKAEVGKTISMPGNGIYMSPNKEYVLHYYTGLADNEILITFEFDINDITLGNLTDKESEVAVKQAKIINLEPIED